jgi:hypothetical protein
MDWKAWAQLNSRELLRGMLFVSKKFIPNHAKTNGSAFAELRIRSSAKAKVLDKSEPKEITKVA